MSSYCTWAGPASGCAGEMYNPEWLSRRPVRVRRDISSDTVSLELPIIDAISACVSGTLISVPREWGTP